MADFERVVNEESILVFQPNGARILELTLAGHKISGVVTRGDGSEASTHPCSPNFDRDTAGLRLPRHGIVRNERVSVVSSESNRLRTHKALIASNYPEGVILEQTYVLTPRALEIHTVHANMGTEAAPVNYGHHTYFLSPQGWEEATLDGTPINMAIREDSVLRLREVSGLQIPGQPGILIMQEGLPFANPWTGSSDKGYDSSYFSFSTIEGNHEQDFFGSPASLIGPNQSRYNRLTIAILR